MRIIKDMILFVMCCVLGLICFVGCFGIVASGIAFITTHPIIGLIVCVCTCSVLVGSFFYKIIKGE